MFALDQSSSLGPLLRIPAHVHSARCRPPAQDSWLCCRSGELQRNSARRGTTVISVDPLYRLDTDTIRDQVAATYDQQLERAEPNSQQFVWDTFRSVEEPRTASWREEFIALRPGS